MKPTLLFAILLAAALGACAPAYYVEVEHEPVISPTAPPADLEETPTPPPTPEAVWSDGYWYWTGDRYAWVSGYWSHPPERGFVWVHPGWIFVQGVFRFMPGRWAHPHRVPRYPYFRPPHRPAHHR